MQNTTKDPTKLAPQYNLRIPWDFKQFLDAKASELHVSQNQLGVDALFDKFGAEFARHQAKAPR